MKVKIKHCMYFLKKYNKSVNCKKKNQERVATHFEAPKKDMQIFCLFLSRHYVNAMSVRIKMNNSRF